MNKNEIDIDMLVIEETEAKAALRQLDKLNSSPCITCQGNNCDYIECDRFQEWHARMFKPKKRKRHG